MAAVFNWLMGLFLWDDYSIQVRHKEQGVKTKYQVKGRRKKHRR